MFFILSENSRGRGSRRLSWWLATLKPFQVKSCFFFFFANSLISWSQTCKLLIHIIKVRWKTWAKKQGIWSVMLERVSRQGSLWNRRKEYKLDAYVLDMMANKKWVLVRVSTRHTLPRPNENWLSIEKQWQIKWTLMLKRQRRHFPDRIKPIALNPLLSHKLHVLFENSNSSCGVVTIRIVEGITAYEFTERK